MNVAKLMTVDDLKRIVQAHGAEFAVAMLYFPDPPLGMQYVTYGTHPQAKVCASDLSEEIAAWIDRGECKSMSPATGPAQVIESFKLDAAKNKAENERLREVNADFLVELAKSRDALKVYVAKLAEFGCEPWIDAAGLLASHEAAIAKAIGEEKS